MVILYLCSFEVTRGPERKKTTAKKHGPLQILFLYTIGCPSLLAEFTDSTA